MRSGLRTTRTLLLPSVTFDSNVKLRSTVPAISTSDSCNVRSPKTDELSRDGRVGDNCVFVSSDRTTAMTESRYCGFYFQASHPRLRSIAWFVVHLQTKVPTEIMIPRYSHEIRTVAWNLAVTQRKTETAMMQTAAAKQLDSRRTNHKPDRSILSVRRR